MHIRKNKASFLVVIRPCRRSGIHPHCRPKPTYVAGPFETERECSIVKLRNLVLPALMMPALLAPSAVEARVGRAARGGGLASWYGPGFGGHRTASGERFNTGAFTAAHRSLPFGTRVRVTCGRTGRSVVVRINDRGPYALGRIIDLSYASARAIGMTGTDRVTLARL